MNIELPNLTEKIRAYTNTFSNQKDVILNINNSGHTLLVYEIIYENGEPQNAILINSASNFDTTTSKLTWGLSWNNTLNKNTNIYEGSIKKLI